MPKDLFTTDQLQEIENAVKQAESLSGGEIVPVFIRQASTYEVALWRGGFLASALAGAIMILLYYTTQLLLFLPPLFWLFIPFTAGMFGALLILGSPPLRRFMLGISLMQSKVEAKAKAAFYDYNVTFTEQRSGILLLISFFERKAMILADVGISELVQEEVWQSIVKDMVQGIRQGELTSSICAAILKCGDVVAESGLQRGDDDRNELSDSVIIES